MTDKFRLFVEQMANMTTPDDPGEIESRRVTYARDYNMHVDDVTAEDVIDDISGDEESSEARAFWEMIRQARKLLKEFP